MASLSLSPQFETNVISNGKVIELLKQLKSAKAHGKNYIKVTPPLRNRLSLEGMTTKSISLLSQRLRNMLQRKFHSVKAP